VGQPTQACTAISDVLRKTSDPDDRASLFDDLIGALQAAGNIKGVASAVTERRLLSARVHDSPARIAELAFDEDEANWTRNADRALSVASFRAHLESSVLNVQRRVRAARILMMAADGDLDEPLAHYTVTASSQLSTNNAHSALVLRFVHLIYHTIFGDAERALRIADDIQAETRQIERSWDALTFERNCAFARQLVGTGANDYSCFETGFSKALDASMMPLALWFAGSLMSVLVDDGDLTNAQKWIRIAEGLSESIAPEDWPFEYVSTQIDIALLLGDYPKARRYAGYMERIARYPSKRVSNDVHIYRLRISQFSGERWSPERHLAALLEHHELGKRLTRHDDHMEVLWKTLNAVGEPKQASELLRDYLLHHRRERRPCRHMLRARTSSDPAWITLPPGTLL
jgi:hypothetical protein